MKKIIFTLIIIALAAATVFGWIAYKNQENTEHANVTDDNTLSEEQTLGEPTETFTSEDIGITFKYFKEQGTPNITEVVRECRSFDDYMIAYDAFLATGRENETEYVQNLIEERIDPAVFGTCRGYEIVFENDTHQSFVVYATNDAEAAWDRLPAPDKGGLAVPLPPNFEYDFGPMNYCACENVWGIAQGENEHDVSLYKTTLDSSYAYFARNEATETGIMFLIGEYTPNVRTHFKNIGDINNLQQLRKLDEVVATLRFVPVTL